MPQVIVLAIAYLVPSQLLVAAVSIGFSLYQANRQRQKARDAYNKSLTDRLVMTVQAQGVRSRVYGRARNVDGVLFKAAWGDKSQYYTLVVALAGHEVDAIEQIYANDLPLQFDEDHRCITAPYLQPARHSRSLKQAVSPGPVSIDLGEVPDAGSVHVSVTAGGVGTRPDRQEYTVDGTVVSFTATASADATVTWQYSGGDSYLGVRAFTGAPGQDLSPYLISRLGEGMVTADHKFEGIACLLIDMTYGTDVYASGVPTFSAVMRGAKVLDPRTGLTAWSDNPALCARDWALYEYGGGCAADEVDEASFTAAANVCDLLQTYARTDGRSETARLYRCGYVAHLDGNPEDHLAELVEGMAGRWGWAGGQLRVRAGAYAAPVATLDDSWLADTGERTVAPGRSMAEAYNVIRATIADAEHAYTETPLPPMTMPAPVIAADGMELPQEVAYLAVTYAPQAQHIAAVSLRDQYDSLTARWPCNLKAWQLELFDVVVVNSTRYGWSGKTFEVLGWRHSPDGGVVLTLKETGASIYAVDTTFEALQSLPNTSLPDPLTVGEVTGIAVTDGLAMQGDGTVINATTVTWGAIDDEAVLRGGQVEVQYADASQELPADWASVRVQGSATSAVVRALPDGGLYVFRVRAINGLGVRGKWSAHTVKQILGKSALPSDVSGLVVDDDGATWTHVSDLDVISGGGYVLRWQPGQVTEWESAQPLHAGILTASPYRWTLRPSGVVTVLCKAVDASRNYSASAAARTVTLTGNVVRNVVDSFDYGPTYPGTLAAGAVSGGQILAPVITYAYGEASRQVYGAPAAEFYKPDQWGAIDYTTDWWTPTNTRAGDAVFLDVQATNAVGLQIEYQSDGGLVYGSPSDAAYGAAGDPYYVSDTSAWQAWPGAVALTDGVRYRWRIRTQQNTAQTAISAVTAYLDGQTIEEVIPVTAIGAGGVRLPLARSYRALTAVVGTLNGGTAAVKVEAMDMDSTLGPLVQAFDATLAAVSASASFVIKGY